MWTELSDPAILARLGNRIKEYRIQLGLKQSEVARYSCVGINTIYKIEKGQPVSTILVVSVLRTLGLLENLEVLVPEIGITPLQLLKIQEKKAKRIRSKKKE